MNEFSTKIKIINGNPYVEVPKDILEQIFKVSGKVKDKIPIKGKINSANYIQTLVMYEGD